jgi:hypothetical protein
MILDFGFRMDLEFGEIWRTWDVGLNLVTCPPTMILERRERPFMSEKICRGVGGVEK